MKKKVKFTCVADINDINDSMEVESGTTFARLEKGKYVVTLEVKGDVRVLYKDEIYKTPCRFPEELAKMFHDGTAWGNPKIEIAYNNWGEIFISEKKGNVIKWTGISDVVDDFPFTEERARQDLEEYLDQYIKDCVRA